MQHSGRLTERGGGFKRYLGNAHYTDHSSKRGFLGVQFLDWFYNSDKILKWDHCIDSWLRFRPNWQYFVKGGFPQYIVEMFVFLDVDSFSSAPWSESKIPSLENKIHVDRNRRRELHISEFSNGTVTAILQRIKVKKSQSYFNFVWTVGKVTLYWNWSFLIFSFIIYEKKLRFYKIDQNINYFWWICQKIILMESSILTKTSI